MFRACLTTIALTFSSFAHAQTVSTEPPRWTVTLGATGAKVDGQDSQPAANFSVTRVIGKGFVSLSGSVTDSSNDLAPVGLAPTRIEVITLSGGRSIGRFLLNVHVSAGRAVFQQGLFAITPAQNIAVSSKADGYGLGASISTKIKLAKNLMLIPNLEIDYSATRVNRAPIDRVTWPNQIENKSVGVTLSGGSALQTRFGASHQHSLGIMASVLRLGNTSDFIHRAGRVDPVGTNSQSTDTLVDYGATLSFALTHSMGLNMSASRSAWANGSQSTVLGAGLSAAF